MPQFNANFPNLELRAPFFSEEGKKPICILGISPGQDYHKGSKLTAIINGINKNFSSCTVVIGDTLQRYNYELIGHSKQEAYEQSLSYGEEWKNTKSDISSKSNLEILKSLTIPFKIQDWNEWILAKNLEQREKQTSTGLNKAFQLEFANEFLKDLHAVQEKFCSDAAYKDIMGRAISQIYLTKTDCSIDKEVVENLIRQYLEEELAVAKLWERKIGKCIFVYPNSSGGKVSLQVAECYKKLFPVNQHSQLYIQDIEFYTLQNKQKNTPPTENNLLNSPNNSSSNKREKKQIPPDFSQSNCYHNTKFFHPPVNESTLLPTLEELFSIAVQDTLTAPLPSEEKVAIINGLIISFVHRNNGMDKCQENYSGNSANSFNCKLRH